MFRSRLFIKVLTKSVQRGTYLLRALRSTKHSLHKYFPLHIGSLKMVRFQLVRPRTFWLQLSNLLKVKFYVSRVEEKISCSYVHPFSPLDTRTEPKTNCAQKHCPSTESEAYARLPGKTITTPTSGTTLTPNRL